MSAFPDSLDIVELMMAIEEAIGHDETRTPAEREQLLREIEERLRRGDYDLGDLGDDALGILVRRLGPRGPQGQAGAAAEIEMRDEGDVGA
jgi:hypothetical protein